ncbi:MAG: Uncharacterised protein [Cellulomonadaceae bacterium TMED98]|nr:MAG: Uncharacterised protein [Cellulomonadaceae bacterium TMED98]
MPSTINVALTATATLAGTLDWLALFDHTQAMIPITSAGICRKNESTSATTPRVRPGYSAQVCVSALGVCASGVLSVAMLSPCGIGYLEGTASRSTASTAFAPRKILGDGDATGFEAPR